MIYKFYIKVEGRYYRTDVSVSKRWLSREEPIHLYRRNNIITCMYRCITGDNTATFKDAVSKVEIESPPLGVRSQLIYVNEEQWTAWSFSIKRAKDKAFTTASLIGIHYERQPHEICT